jgi:NADH-quinone oxidoreductase subunit E
MEESFSMTADLSMRMEKVLGEFSDDSGNLIPILQKVQGELGYIFQPAMERVAAFLRLTENQVYGVASFYAQFRFTPPGRHSISACLGTACHVRGGERIMENLARDLGVKPGESTPDGRFDLNRVACLGCCALAPVVMVDKDIHANITGVKLKRILKNYE